ncbi:MAG TPA: hypothetical protein VM324_09835 [Egibacteraceae bacterium]|nr:hypothetical protein [Egibacteraceae bacterium]
MPQPRRHRMRRPARLDSARSWLESGAEVTVRAYARRYGVDRYTACDELGILGVALSAKDQRWSVRPPPVPKRSRREEPEGVQDGLPDGWLEWGGELMFVAGFTSGGAPYGVRVQDFPAHDLPEELKAFAEERRAEERRLTALAAEQRARFGRQERDVPF